MPAEGVKLSPRDKILSNEEVLRLARVFAALGINKIRLTGGEPTLRKDLVNIVRTYLFVVYDLATFDYRYTICIIK